MVFPPSQNYVIRPEERNERGYADLHTLEYRESGTKYRKVHFLITQCKRRKYETAQGTWDEGKEQLHRYLTSISSKSTYQNHRMYGIIAVGRLAEFYEFNRNTATLRTVPVPANRVPNPGKKFHIGREFNEVQAILDYIKANH